MIDYAYCHRGISALARAHQLGSMSGHLGAAVLAGYYIGEDQNHIKNRVLESIQNEMDRVIRGEESIWYKEGKSTPKIPELFEPLPLKKHGPNNVVLIASALDRNIHQLRQSGHQVIFAALALRALHDHPELVSNEVIEGLVRLMHQFDHAIPGRGYFGEENGWTTGDKISLSDHPGRVVYSTIEEMQQSVMELVLAHGNQHRRGFGGLFHIINHASALTTLAELGYGDLAVKGLAAHRHHVRLWLELPVLDHELGKLKQAECSPLQPEYWKGKYQESRQWSGWLTHRLKTIHGFYHIWEAGTHDGNRQAIESQFLHLMA